MPQPDADRIADLEDRLRDAYAAAGELAGRLFRIPQEHRATVLGDEPPPVGPHAWQPTGRRNVDDDGDEGDAQQWKCVVCRDLTWAHGDMHPEHGDPAPVACPGPPKGRLAQVLDRLEAEQEVIVETGRELQEFGRGNGAGDQTLPEVVRELALDERRHRTVSEMIHNLRSALGARAGENADDAAKRVLRAYDQARVFGEQAENGKQEVISRLLAVRVAVGATDGQDTETVARALQTHHVTFEDAMRDLLADRCTPERQRALQDVWRTWEATHRLANGKPA